MFNFLILFGVVFDLMWVNLVYLCVLCRFLPRLLEFGVF